MVTGGSSGFGRHFSRFLASNGAKVTLAARRAMAFSAAVDEINGAGGRAQSVTLDVTVPESIIGQSRPAGGRHIATRSPPDGGPEQAIWRKVRRARA
nr:SDR family NAD(P)-dependent oxidoreductase [Bradyrhizobium sp. 6(2017)]